MNFSLYDITHRNPYLSLALDEALCLWAAEQDDFRAGVRVWAGPPSIVLGRTNRPEENVRPELLDSLIVGKRRRPRPDEIFLCRRASGGGTVLHGPGNINFSVFASLAKFPAVYPVRDSYTIFLGMVTRALEVTIGVPTRMRGDSDLVIGAGPARDGATATAADDGLALKKISGNAQFRKRGVVVHHGTLLFGNRLGPLIGRVLAHPPKEPAYRAGRTHGEFLSSLPADFDPAAFFAALESEVAAFAGARLEPLAGRPARHAAALKLARKLASRIYVAEDWILRAKMPRPV